MSRSLTTDFRNETIAASLAPVIFAFLAFQSGAVRVHNGIGTKTWAGNDYTGLGLLGGIAPIEETVETRAAALALSLSGVPSSLIATVLADNYSGRAVKIWFGALNATGAVIADPNLRFSGRMNNVEFDDDPSGTATIRVFAESKLVDLQRSKERRYTHQDQQIDFPSDTALRKMPTAQSQPLYWGGKQVFPTPGRQPAYGTIVV